MNKKFVNGVAIATAMALGGTMGVGSAEEKKYLEPEWISPVYEYSDCFEGYGMIRFYEYLANVDMSSFDETFVDLYRNGIISINNVKYDLNELFIETGFVNGEERIILKSYKEPKYDILTSENVEIERISIMTFKNSKVFLDIYELFKENYVDGIFNIDENNFQTFKDIVLKYDGTRHENVPELAYNPGNTKTLK